LQLAQERQEYLKIISEKNIELDRLIKKIDAVKSEILASHNKNEKLQQILSFKRDSVKLQDLIDDSGRRQYREDLHKKLTRLYDFVVNGEKKAREYRQTIVEVRESINIKDIYNKFEDLFKLFSIMLQVKVPKKKRGIFPSLKELGNEYPRTLLAYFYTIINIMIKQRDNPFVFPIVIDTPLQQNPDNETAGIIIKFIEDNCPDSIQLIYGSSLGTEKKSKINLINLTSDKYNLLKKEQYDVLRSEYSGLIEEHFEKIRIVKGLLF
jgi:hypothetical protein